jgi:GrpB protein
LTISPSQASIRCWSWTAGSEPRWWHSWWHAREQIFFRCLDVRLVAARVEPSAEPQEAWRRLREAEGRRTTIIDLYELVARRRGLAGHQLPQAERAELARSVMPVLWPGFARTEGSDRQDLSVEVVAYDPAWPGRYQRWRDRLAGQLADTALRIEHVGSTAVPGLPAKPTIDVQVSVADLDDEIRYVAQIEQAGVQLPHLCLACSPAKSCWHKPTTRLPLSQCRQSSR